MSGDTVTHGLGAMIRATGAEDVAVAASEFPFSADVLDRFVRGVRRRRAGRAAAFAVVALPILGAAAFGLGHLWWDAPVTPAVSPSPSASVSVSASPTASPSMSLGPSASATPSRTATTTTTTTTTSAPPPPPPVSVPGVVPGVSAQTGGGSGEVMVHWKATADATGYRVYRAATSGGPFARAASYSVVTGATTAEYSGAFEIFQIWMPSLDSFEYIEVVDGQPACFRVAAFNEAGAGPRSGVACASPP